MRSLCISALSIGLCLVAVSCGKSKSLQFSSGKSYLVSYKMTGASDSTGKDVTPVEVAQDIQYSESDPVKKALEEMVKKGGEDQQSWQDMLDSMLGEQPKEDVKEPATIDPAKPADDPTKPPDPAKPPAVDPAKPVDPATPADPAKPVDPATPADPTPSVDKPTWGQARCLAALGIKTKSDIAAEFAKRKRIEGAHIVGGTMEKMELFSDSDQDAKIVDILIVGSEIKNATASFNSPSGIYCISMVGAKIDTLDIKYDCNAKVVVLRVGGTIGGGTLGSMTSGITAQKLPNTCK
jgi:hypothetical protein